MNGAAAIAAAPELRVIRDLVERLHGAAPGELRITRQPLRGGLEAASVERLAVHFRDRTERERVVVVVVERLAAAAADVDALPGIVARLGREVEGSLRSRLATGGP